MVRTVEINEKKREVNQQHKKQSPIFFVALRRNLFDALAPLFEPLPKQLPPLDREEPRVEEE